MLTAEQYQLRLEQAKAELLREIRFLAQHWNQGSKIHQDMIRRRMVRELEHAPMDLLVMDDGPDTIRHNLDLQNLPL